VAIGFNIIYNATGIINFAQGEFVMLGAMIAISLSKFMPVWLAIPLAVIITASVGALIEFGIIRRLKNATVLNAIIVTIGLSILLKELALHIWGDNVRSLHYFTGNECSSIQLFGAYMSPQVLWVLSISAVIMISLTIFFKYSLTGRAMRACAANPTAAALCGIKVNSLVSFSFMLSAGIGALAGCVISPITQTTYDCGTSLALKGFTVAIMGGLGNSAGAVGAGLILGCIEAASISILPMAYKDIVSIGVLLLLLFLKPNGLFGNREAGSQRSF
jgi:branched-chain amino acid transport system permease protein